MSFFGMGPLETVAIILIAFLALGPGKSIDAARTAGKFIRNLRQTINEVVSAINVDVTEDSSKTPPSRTGSSPDKDRTDNDPT